MADDNKLTVTIDGKDNLSGELKKIESGVIRFVGAVSSALAALSVIAFPILESARFQKELLEAAKTTDYAKEQIEQLRDGLSDLSTQINVSAKDLAKIATAGGQLGIGKGSVDALLSFTEEVARAVTALDISAEEATMSLGKLITIFDVPQSEFRNVISALNEVSNTSTATATQLFDVVRRIGNLGGAVNLSGATALSAAMIDLGLTAETAGTTITKIFADMRAQAQAFASFIGEGMTVEKWTKMLQGDGLKALDLFLDKLNKLPPAMAAVAKIEMAGGGRIFEAVTKLQDQRLRATLLEEQVQARKNELDRVRGTLTAQQLEFETKMIESLEKQAKQANIVAKHAGAAAEAYERGDSAVKEQQTVLSGLSAQWQVFVNNISKAAMGLGDELLRPLTDFLKLASSVMREADVGSQLAAGARDVVAAFQDAASAMRYFLGGVKSISEGIDWSSVIRIGAIAAFGKALSLVGGYMTRLHTQTAAASGIYRGFTTALFGTTQAAQEANRAFDEQRKKQEALSARSGSMFQKGIQGATNFAQSLVTVERLQERQTGTVQRLAAQTTELAARQRDLAAAGQTVGRALRSRAALEAAIADAVLRRDAAEAAGNRRSASRVQADINRWTAALPAITNAELAIERVNNRTARLNAVFAATNQRITEMSTGAVGMVTAFRAAQAAGMGFAASLAAAFSSGGAGSQGFVGRLVTGLRAAATSAQQFGAGLAAAFTQGSAQATGFTATLRGTQAVAARLAVTVAEIGMGGLTAARTGVVSLTLALRQATLAALGLGTAATAGLSGIAKTAVATASVLSLVGRAFSGIVAFASRLVGWVFFAMMAIEALRFLGVLDKVKDAIGNLWEMFGGNKQNLPEWLQSDREIKNTTATLERQSRSYEALAKAAGSFSDKLKDTVSLMSDASTAMRLLDFSKNGSSSLDKISEGTTATLAGYAKLAKTQSDLKILEEERTAVARDLEKAQRALANSSDWFKESNSKRVENYAARLATIDETIEKLRDGSVKLKLESERAMGTLATSAIRADDALLKQRDGYMRGAYALQEWVAAVAEWKAAQAALEAKQADQSADKAPGGRDGAAKARELSVELVKLEAAAQKSKERMGELADEVSMLSPNNAALKNFMKSVQDNLTPDPAVAEKIGKDLVEALYRGVNAQSGQAVPKITANDLLQAGATIAVSEKLRVMYTDLQTQAQASADKAKNAMSNALEDTRRAARDAEKSFQDFNKTLEETKRKASNWKADQSLDADLRKRLSNIDIEYNKERDLVQARYGWNKELLAREMFSLDETFRKKRENEQRIVDLQKAQRDVKPQIADFERLVQETGKWVKAIEDANKVLQDPSASLDARSKALKAREDAEIKAKETAQQAEKLAKDLASIQPIGDKLVIPEETLKKFRDISTALGPQIADSMRVALPEVQKTYSEMATRYGELASNMSTAIKQAQGIIEAFGRSHGMEMDAVIRKFAEAAAASKDYAKVVADAAKAIPQAATGGSLINQERMQQAARDAVTAIQDGTKDLKIPLTIDQEKTAKSIEAELAAIVGTVAKKDVELSATLSTASLTAMTEAVKNQVKPELGVLASRASLDKMKADIENMKPEIFVNVRGNYSDAAGRRGYARGGLIETLKSFASGGHVRGPGSGTSDSILSWLSNGEYVIDALTTARFGSKFFAGLQAAARGGTAASFLSKMQNVGIPRFASGGPVAAPFSGSLPVVEQALAGAGGGIGGPTNRDVVDINLNVGNEKVSLFAERQQAAKFVKALKSMESGS